MKNGWIEKEDWVNSEIEQINLVNDNAFGLYVHNVNDSFYEIYFFMCNEIVNTHRLVE